MMSSGPFPYKPFDCQAARLAEECRAPLGDRKSCRLEHAGHLIASKDMQQLIQRQSAEDAEKIEAGVIE